MEKNWLMENLKKKLRFIDLHAMQIGQEQCGHYSQLTIIISHEWNSLHFSLNGSNRCHQCRCWPNNTSRWSQYSPNYKSNSSIDFCRKSWIFLIASLNSLPFSNCPSNFSVASTLHKTSPTIARCSNCLKNILKSNGKWKMKWCHLLHGNAI